MPDDCGDRQTEAANSKISSGNSQVYSPLTLLEVLCLPVKPSRSRMERSISMASDRHWTSTKTRKRIPKCLFQFLLRRDLLDSTGVKETECRAQSKTADPSLRADGPGREVFFLFRGELVDLNAHT